MIREIIFNVISAWQVIAVGLVIMIVLPLIFYFASFDKAPVRIKRIPRKNLYRRERVSSENEAGVDVGEEREDYVPEK